MGSCYKGHCLRGALTCQSQYLYCYYKGNKIDLQGKMLSQFTPVSGQIYMSPRAFIWLARRKLLQVWLESKKQVREVLSHSVGTAGSCEKPSCFLRGPWKLGSQLVWAHSHTTQRCSHFSPAPRWGPWATEGSYPVWGSKPAFTATCSVCKGERCAACGQWSMMAQIS